MKKIFVILIFAAFSLLIARNSAQYKPGNDKPDAGFRHCDPAADAVDGSAAPFAQSTAGTYKHRQPRYR